MLIRNCSSQDRDIAATGQHVPAHHQVEVSTELGKSLCKQVDNWEPVEDKKADKAKGDEV